uniref:Uncharacterized protein n=1 Tax=Rhizophora mucronata TaxID=61149 RepID=A0A2P2QSZ1_RHIMU
MRFCYFSVFFFLGQCTMILSCTLFLYACSKHASRVFKKWKLLVLKRLHVFYYLGNLT